jgi:Protein of unknown function (DUF2946)
MTVKTALRTNVRHAPNLARWAIAFFVFVAFAFQSYVEQTHIHFPGEAAVDIFAPAGNGQASAGIAAAGKHSQNKTPSKDDPAHCPICQEILYAGHYVTPAYVPLLLPSEPVSFIPVSVAVSVFTSVASHSWHGRAPPRI